MGCYANIHWSWYSSSNPKLKTGANGGTAEQAGCAMPACSGATVMNGESLKSLIDLSVPVLRERLDCPNNHKSKAHLVTQLAKRLGILPNKASPSIVLQLMKAEQTTSKSASEKKGSSKQKAAQKRDRSRLGPVLAPGCLPPVPCRGPDGTKTKAKRHCGTRTNHQLIIHWQKLPCVISAIV